MVCTTMCSIPASVPGVELARRRPAGRGLRHELPARAGVGRDDCVLEDPVRRVGELDMQVLDEAVLSAGPVSRSCCCGRGRLRGRRCGRSCCRRGCER
jgi:hypothetical protein